MVGGDGKGGSSRFNTQYYPERKAPHSKNGNTIVLAGVKFQIMTPYPDRPNQGGLMCSAEVRPVAGKELGIRPT